MRRGNDVWRRGESHRGGEGSDAPDCRYHTGKPGFDLMWGPAIILDATDCVICVVGRSHRDICEPGFTVGFQRCRPPMCCPHWVRVFATHPSAGYVTSREYWHRESSFTRCSVGYVPRFTDMVNPMATRGN